MSANNWTICPKCYENAVKEKEKLQKEMLKSYGKISIEEFKELNEKAEKPIQVENSLREDYEIYMTEIGQLVINYKCHCGVCKFSFEHIPEIMI